MADKSSSPAKPATCCPARVLIDTNDTHRRCSACGAEWTRESREGDWKPVDKK
jgi:hypothetical protein